MKTFLKTSVGVIALLGGAGVALAQGSDTSGTQSIGFDMTCDEFANLEPDQAERALYYLAGYQAAQSETGMPSDTTASAGGTSGADVTTGAGSDTSASAGTGTSSEMESDTTAAADSGAADMGTSGTSGTDTTASADTGAADMGTSGTSGTDTTTTGATGTESQSMTGTASGFPDLSVESAMSACEESPDATVASILQQQGGSAQ